MIETNWPLVALKSIAIPATRPVDVIPGRAYRTIGVKLWGEGAYERATIDGSQTAARKLSLVAKGDLIINKIWVRHGSIAIAADDVAGCAASNEFPTFALDQEQVEPRWLHWLTKTRGFWSACDHLSQGSSGKNRIKPEKFLTIEIPLPPLEQQRRIVAYLDALSAKIAEVRSVRDDMTSKADALMRAAYRRIVDGASKQPLANVAPLTRRPAVVSVDASYPQVSVRSFGRGTFHGVGLSGSEISWQKPYQVKAGDILVSNIKAWEGAIAVAAPEDDGRFGSHRYLTYVPVAGVATSLFVCFHLLSAEGLYAVGEASPGSADRNRTLGTKAFAQVPIPIPEYSKQLWFDSVYRQVEQLKHHQAESAAELDALLPAVLDRAFKGEL